MPAKPGAVTAVFPDLKKGPYPIAAFHDEDENQDLTMGGTWPREGYATSGALDAYDTPTFRQASVGGGDVTLNIHNAD